MLILVSGFTSVDVIYFKDLDATAYAKGCLIATKRIFRIMPVTPEYRAFIEDLVEPLGHVSTRRMFGGLGFFYRGLMFALIVNDVLHFKVDEENRSDFEVLDMEPFSYIRKGKKRGLKSYWTVPVDVLDNEDEFLVWSRKAVDVALRADALKTNCRIRSA